MKSKKSQAAMEFLMTYGWAILVVLIAIGALAYSGILDPERFLPYDYWDDSVRMCHVEYSHDIAAQQIGMISCINKKFSELNITSCTEAVSFYSYTLKNYMRVHEVLMDKHTINIVEFQKGYCVLDMEWLQCVTLKGDSV